MHLVKSCSLDKSSLPANLPTRKVTRSEKYGGLIYPVESFFSFIKSVEFVFSNLLTAKAITIYGDEIVGKIIDCLNNNSTVHTVVSGFFPVETREKVREMDELRLFLLNLYGKFRGKEFVRAYMGSGKKSLELGIRQTTAVLSNPDRKSNDSDEYVKLKEVMKETVLETSLDMNNN